MREALSGSILHVKKEKLKSEHCGALGTGMCQVLMQAQGERRAASGGQGTGPGSACDPTAERGKPTFSLREQ